MDEFKIEKGFTLPPKRLKSQTYPFNKMVIGDSFLVPALELHMKQSVQSSVLQKAKRAAPTYSFVTQQVEGGVRVWRVK